MRHVLSLSLGPDIESLVGSLWSLIMRVALLHFVGQLQCLVILHLQSFTVPFTLHSQLSEHVHILLQKEQRCRLMSAAHDLLVVSLVIASSYFSFSVMNMVFINFAKLTC